MGFKGSVDSLHMEEQLFALPNGACVKLGGMIVTRLGDMYEVGSWGRLDRLFTIEEALSLLTEEDEEDEEDTGRGEGASGPLT